MQAILKEKHAHFCIMINDIMATRSLQSQDIKALESELCTIYQNYQQRLNDIRELIHEYDVKKNAIRKKVKELVREKSIK